MSVLKFDALPPLGHNRGTLIVAAENGKQIKVNREETGYNVENPNAGKTTGVTELQLSLHRECTMASYKATTLSSLSSPQAAVLQWKEEATTSLSLTHSLTLSLSHGCAPSLSQSGKTEKK